MIFVLVSLGVWVAKNASNSDNGFGSTATIKRQSAKNDGNNIKLEQEDSIAKAAAKISPSVVSISSQSQRGAYITQSAGTGIIVSDNGYIMTNKHVVDSISEATVTTNDGDIYEKVKVVGSDPLNDVAFLKVDKPKNFKAAELGESSTLRIGQTVLAVGNSLGEYQNTVTSGIVSGLGRPVIAQSEAGDKKESLTDLVQTDAAINPGNSGGPLVNLAGQVIGINTTIVSNANGIGFAIPINATKGMLKGLLKNGKVERAYLGVTYLDINPAIAKAKKLPVKTGALVAKGYDSDESAIIPGSPAEKAGIKNGDIITKIGDLSVGKQGGVSSLVSEYKPGDKIDITLIRGGSEQKVSANLSKYEAQSSDSIQDQATTEAPAPSRQERPSNLRDFLFGY